MTSLLVRCASPYLGVALLCSCRSLPFASFAYQISKATRGLTATGLLTFESRGPIARAHKSLRLSLERMPNSIFEGKSEQAVRVS